MPASATYIAWSMVELPHRNILMVTGDVEDGNHEAGRDEKDAHHDDQHRTLLTLANLFDCVHTRPSLGIRPISLFCFLIPKLHKRTHGVGYQRPPPLSATEIAPHTIVGVVIVEAMTFVQMVCAIDPQWSWWPTKRRKITDALLLVD